MMVAMRIVLLLTAVALLPAGCRNEKIEEKSIEGVTGGQVRIDGGDISLVNSAGAVGLGGKVSDDFPKEVPIYPGAKVTLATRSAKGKPAWSLALVTGDDTEHVMTFYRSHLAEFQSTSDRTLGETSMSVWQSPQLDVTLVVAQAPSQETSISMTVSNR
jgi:hypothetical protein